MSLSSLFISAEPRSRVADVGLAAIRVFGGAALALAHGLGKMPPSEGFVGYIGGMGFPAPALFAWAVVFAELVCGALLAVGLFTRPAALVVLVNMLVAAFVAHAGDPFGDREGALLFAAIALLFVFAGAGRYSVDAMLRQRRAGA